MSRQPRLKTRAEVLRIGRPGRLLSRLFRLLDDHIAPGVTTGHLADLAAHFAERNGASCAQKGFNGFPSEICTSVNSIAAHGVPGDRRLDEGDLLTVDCVLSVDSWHADAAWTYAVGELDPDARRLLRAAWQSTRAAALACRAGERFGNVGAAAERTARSFGCSILGDFTGHGIGRAIHEDPPIPFGTGHGDGPAIVPGLVVTIEPVLTLGEARVEECGDGFGYETVDGARTAQFECTVAVFSDRTEALTLSPEDFDYEFPPFV